MSAFPLDSVMAATKQSWLPLRPGVIQRKCACDQQTTASGECEECKKKRGGTLKRAAVNQSLTPEVPPIVHEVLRSPGQPLDAATRAFMEPRFGHDFSGVRVHTDAKAAESAQAVNALAYAVGNNVVFGAGRYAPQSNAGRKLIAHELTHTLQQGISHASLRSASLHVNEASDSDEIEAAKVAEAVVSSEQTLRADAVTPSSLSIQRAGDPAAIPRDFPCPTDLTAGRPAGTDLLFPVDKSDITSAHTALLTAFRTTWLAAGGTDDILVHGYASTDGTQEHNWTLSCNRALEVQTELIRLGIPAARISVVAHGESTDFGPGAAPNRHAVVSTSPAGIFPLITGVLTARDNFAGRSTARFGVGEIIDLTFVSFPPRPAADFGGLEWHLVSGGGTLAGVTNVGTATYTAPATAAAVRLELRVATGATAGRVISTHTIAIVIPNGVRMVVVPGTAPNTSPLGGTIPVGTFGAGFLANVFVDPKDVSFQGVVFGEGTVASVVTPAGSFFGPSSVHPANTFGPAHGGNATTGTAVSPPQDQIATSGPPSGSLLGTPTCGASDFLWAIPWEFSVAGSPRARFATANHHQTSTFFCNATIEKGGAGPFCRRINGTTC